MFSFTRCSYVFLFCAIGVTAVWFACFQRKITNSKRKRKRSLAHTSIDHAKTKQTKTEKNTIQEKQVSNTEILENLKTVLNQRIHFYHNGHDPITIRNSFHDSIKMIHSTFVRHVHRCSLNTLCR